MHGVVADDLLDLREQRVARGLVGGLHAPSRVSRSTCGFV